MSLVDHLRPEARCAPDSGIVAVANHARGRVGLIPLWAGEGDKPTPAFIAETAARALVDGETFYTWQRGIPELRQSLADYHGRHFGRSFHPDEFIVTSGGMHAIQMAIQAVAGAGDEIVFLSPAWPNFAGALGIAGGRPVPVLLDHSDNGWSLDLARLEAAIGPHTKAIFVNSPSNPTGWTAERDELRQILDMARRNGLWIIADEIYAHYHYGVGRAPSFLDVMEDEDKVLFVNSFSKNWAMTGWRVGWVRTHPQLSNVFENLVQYSSSGTPQFMQRGAVAALDQGDEFIREQVERARKARDIVCARLGATGRARFVAPQGAFYLFFAIDGISDTRKAAFDIVDRANVAIAPGTAFGSGGEGFLRLCFHRAEDQVKEAADRLANWIETV